MLSLPPQNDVIKVAISILLLTLFSVRPAFQVGNYIYFQSNIDQIIADFCVNKERPQLNCNGKCYLADKLTVSTNSANSIDTSTLALVDAFFPIYFQEVTQLSLPFNSNSIQKVQVPYAVVVTTTYFDKVDPPPRAIVLNTTGV